MKHLFVLPSSYTHTDMKIRAMGLYAASWNIFLHYVGLVVVDTSFTVMASMYLNVAYILESYGCRTLMVTTIV